MFERTTWLCAGIIVLLAGPSASLADEKDGYPALAKMLEVGWGTTAPFRTAGDQQAQSAFHASGRSPRTLYAAAVVHIKQGRYADAQKLVDELLAIEGNHLPALRARVWLTAILKNYPSAMVAAEKLAESLGSAEAENVDEEARIREYVSFLGRIYGFLGGPASGSVHLDERKSSERKVVERLSEGRKVLFEDSRDAVLQKHFELTDATDVKTEAAKEAAAEAKTKTLEEIAEQRTERAARAKELQERSDKLKGELRDELAEIAKADGPLVAELAQLDRRAAVLNRELLTIESQIAILRSALNQEKDPVVRAQILSDIDRLALIGSRYEADLFGVNRLASGVQQQRAALALRQRKAEVDVSSQLERINKEGTDLARLERRAGAMEKRTQRATPATPASALSLRATASALATYDPFPLEQEKARILKELK